MRAPICYGVVQTGPHLPDGIPCVRVVDLSDPALSTRRMLRTSTEIHNEYRRTQLERDDILFALRGDIGFVRLTPGHLAGANLTRGIARLAVDQTKADPRYVYQAVQGPTTRRAIRLRINGSALKEVPIEALRTVPIPLPSHPVQRCIAKALQDWDTGIETMNRLLRGRRKQKRGLLQQLLTGERRFPEFRDQPWVERRVGEVLQETSRLVDWNDNELYRLASIRRGSRGLFDRGSLCGRDIKVKKLHTIREGDFLISHIQAAYGAMGTVPAEFDGAKVSDMYSILTPTTPGSIDMRFVNYLSQRKEMRHMAYLSSNGFFAERLRLNFDPHDFLNRKILLPPTVEEQSKVADVLETLDREIELLTDLHEALREQKKGLLQQLLTGKVRVPASMLKEAAHA